MEYSSRVVVEWPVESERPVEPGEGEPWGLARLRRRLAALSRRWRSSLAREPEQKGARGDPGLPCTHPATRDVERGRWQTDCLPARAVVSGGLGGEQPAARHPTFRRQQLGKDLGALCGVAARANQPRIDVHDAAAALA